MAGAISQPAGRSKRRYLAPPRSTIRVSASDYRSGEAGTHMLSGNPQYTEGEHHFSASSQQDPTCVVEPGTPEDVGKIVRPFLSVPPGIALRSH